jgi:hypothetical protein
MSSIHSGYSFAAAILPGKKEEARRLLTELNSTEGLNPRLPLAKCPSTLFTSGFIVDAQDYHGKTLPASLLFLTTYTGPLRPHIRELIQHCGPGLRELFQCCTSSDSIRSDGLLFRYMLRKNNPDTFYTGIQYITHGDIAREDELREFIEDFIDRQQTDSAFASLGWKEVRQRIQEEVVRHPKFSWAKTKWKKKFSDWWVLNRALIFFIVLFFACGFIPTLLFHWNYIIGILVVLGAVIVTLVILVLCFRINEMRNHFVAPRQPDEYVRAIFEKQNHPVINTMTVGAPLKKGWIRPVFLFIVLRLANMLRGLLYIPTVASARWLAMDKGRRLVFSSNFGNLSESYVRDFIDSKKRARNINLIYGQGIGYPGTKWVRGNGAIADPEGFINDVHLMDHPVLLWYWPFQHLSVDNIINNRKIYLGLFADLNEQDSREWLKRL